MKEINEFEYRRKKNAKIVLKNSCRVKEGETVLILLGEKVEQGQWGIDVLEAEALASAAVDLGANPIIIDIKEYSRTPSYKNRIGVKTIESAMKTADVVIGCSSYFNHLGFSKLGSADIYLTGEKRWMILQPHMEKWEITPEEIEEIPERTQRLGNLLNSSQSIQVTSPAGTDFTFSLMPTCNYTPVLAIIPNYGEIAIVPQYGSESGIIVVDGPTGRGVRPSNELDCKPLHITVESGKIVDFDGDPIQVDRLRRYLNSRMPYAEHVDEVGIPTTRVKANDMCWNDGTHSWKTIHIALGNNTRRKELVHGSLHIDCEINNPVISVDGRIYKQ